MLHNVVLEVVVRPDQLALMEPLQKLFPVMPYYRHSECEFHLLVVVDKGPRYIEQYRFLRDHSLTFVDVATQRDRLVHEFFSGVTLQDRSMRRILLTDIPDDPGAHRVELDNGEEIITLTLPPFRLPRYATAPS